MAQINPEFEAVFTVRGIDQQDTERIARMAKRIERHTYMGTPKTTRLKRQMRTRTWSLWRARRLRWPRTRGQPGWPSICHAGSKYVTQAQNQNNGHSRWRDSGQGLKRATKETTRTYGDTIPHETIPGMDMQINAAHE